MYLHAMGKILIYVIVVVLFLSCKGQKIEQAQIGGVFYALNKGRYLSSSHTLELHNDGSFILKVNIQDAQPQCNGEWKIENGKFVVLKCDEVKDVTETLSNGYLNKREYKLLIISKNKIRYNDYVMLKRK